MKEGTGMPKLDFTKLKPSCQLREREEFDHRKNPGTPKGRGMASIEFSWIAFGLVFGEFVDDLKIAKQLAEGATRAKGKPCP